MSRISAVTEQQNADELRIVETQEIWAKTEPGLIAERLA
jgi:hypothetical protein